MSFTVPDMYRPELSTRMRLRNPGLLLLLVRTLISFSRVESRACCETLSRCANNRSSSVAVISVSKARTVAKSVVEAVPAPVSATSR